MLMTYLLFFIDFIVSFLAIFNAAPLESLEIFFCSYAKIIFRLTNGTPIGLASIP
jgi:hypothetical protein